MKNKPVLYAIAMSLALVLIQFAGSFLGFLGPFFWVYSAVFVAFFGAFPYCALTRRLPVFGMALLPAAIMLAICLPMGEGDGLSAGVTIAIAVVAELLRLIGKYPSPISRRLSYMALSLMPMANTIRMWVDHTAAMQQTVDEMGEAYAAQMQTLVGLNWLLPLMIIATLALAFLGTLVAERRRR